MAKDLKIVLYIKVIQYNNFVARVLVIGVLLRFSGPNSVQENAFWKRFRKLPQGVSKKHTNVPTSISYKSMWYTILVRRSQSWVIVMSKPVSTYLYFLCVLTNERFKVKCLDLLDFFIMKVSFLKSTVIVIPRWNISPSTSK